MNRVYFKLLFLISFLSFCCFSCAFNSGSWGRGEIVFSIPDCTPSDFRGAEITSDNPIGGEPFTEKPEFYAVNIVYDDGSVIYSKNHKAGDHVVVPELSSGQYHISIKGESPNFIFVGESIANVLEEEVCDIEINIQRWKKGMIKLDFSLLDKSVRGLENGVPEFNVAVFNSTGKNVYSGKIDYNTIGDDKRFLIDTTLPVGDYTIRLSGGNADWAYRVNKDLKVSVSDGKVFVCFVNEHEAINYFVSSNGNDETGTGEETNPFKSVAHIAALMNDIFVPVRITILDNVVEEGAVTFSNPKGRVIIEGRPDSSLVVKGGINIPVGTVTLDNGSVISGSGKIAISNNCNFIIKGSAKIAEDTPVLLSPGSSIKIEDSLTNDVAAYVSMAAPKNKSNIISVFETPGFIPEPDLLKNNFSKFKFVTSQNYSLKEDGKAWAILPEGYVGIDDALSVLADTAAKTELIKVFVDDASELAALGKALRSTASSGISVDFRTNPQVSSINSALFSNNSKLSKVIIPSTINTVGDSSFAGCTGLTEITFANGVKSIGKGIFTGCSTLKSVNFSDSITAIADNSFNGCTSLNNITFGNGITSIGNNAFTGSGLNEKITLPASIKTIGNNAFAGCEITDISFSEGITSIGAAAFSNCLQLASVIKFPASLKTIGNNAFAGSNITGILFSEGVTSIGVSAFSNCLQLASVIKFPASLKTIGNNAFEKSNITGVSFSEGITSIGVSAFSNCLALAGVVTFPGTLKTIGNNAFENCSEITGAVFKDGIETIGALSFKGTSKLACVLNMPPSLKTIGNSAFEGCPVAGVNLNKGLVTIGNSAFKDCVELKGDVLISGSVKTIGTEAFYGCVNLNKAVIEKGVTVVSGKSFENSGISSVILPEGLGRIDGSAFAGTKLVSVSIPSSVNGIVQNTFKGCTELSSVEIKEGPSFIDSRAFDSCTSLKNIVIPSSVIYIYSGAFINSGVETVTFNDLNSKWESQAGVFEPGKSEGVIPIAKIVGTCSRPLKIDEAVAKLRYPSANMRMTVFLGSEDEISKLGGAVKNMNGGSLILDLRTSAKNIPAAAFANCLHLKEIYISEGVTGIGHMAFANDSGLLTVRVPKSFNFVSRNAFAGCRNLANVIFTDSSKNWNIQNIFSGDKKSVPVSDSAVNATNLYNTYVQYDWYAE